MNPHPTERPSPGTTPGDGRSPVAVVTDSAAALPAAWRAEYEASGGFASVDLPVLIDGQFHSEEEPHTLPSLVIALAEGRPVTTSRPAPGQLRRVYAALQDAGFTGVVSVHLSSELSGTLEAALLSISGIGPWTVAETLQRSHGSPDHISVGDYHLADFVGQVLVGHRVDDQRMLQLLEPYTGHRQRVVRLLQLSGQRKQGFGPRYAPLDHRNR